jgi:hypothetical protein
VYYGAVLEAKKEIRAKRTALLNRLAIDTAVVPAWWFIEVTNLLATAERRGHITPTQTAKAVKYETGAFWYNYTIRS